MTKAKLAIFACVTVSMFLAGSESVWADEIPVHCIVTAKGTIETGDKFFGHATINLDHTVNPGGIWRHVAIGPSGTPEQVFIGMADSGICTPNGSTVVQLFGVGRLRGRPVSFEVFARDGSPDDYDIVLTDYDGSVVYSSSGLIVRGDISALVP